jgi:hypothetical protein
MAPPDAPWCLLLWNRVARPTGCNPVIRDQPYSRAARAGDLAFWDIGRRTVAWQARCAWTRPCYLEDACTLFIREETGEQVCFIHVTFTRPNDGSEKDSVLKVLTSLGTAHCSKLPTPPSVLVNDANHYHITLSPYIYAWSLHTVFTGA